MSLRSKPGTLISDGKNGALYAPTEGEFLIREKLEALEQFLEFNHDIDPLIKMAAAHYQFEAIYPFTDGNSRTGRILYILYLLQQRLLSAPILYLSRYIIDNKNAYFDGLRAVTEEGAWEDWILFVLKGVEVTAKTACQQIFDIRSGMKRLVAQRLVPKSCLKLNCAMENAEYLCQVKTQNMTNLVAVIYLWISSPLEKT